ncbi:heat shock protein 75 kDa, mitochondrial [Ischnura elegans]|uniref:heat shock protein 75 kDa, mitochondrial n=1 Tax=Ischnura elegans TaxID=197161 RepID=UPI001ED88767|nr:heat shock protein 75 kDa, mitochondrial [Ischnura elegans]
MSARTGLLGERQNRSAFRTLESPGGEQLRLYDFSRVTIMAASMKMQRVVNLGKIVVKFGRCVHLDSKIRPVYNLKYNQGWAQRYRNVRPLSTQSEAEPKDYHSIIKDTEKGTGEADRREFQAETRMLLDIVAKSLYSDKEVFIRELISNASDALEKQRYDWLTADPSGGSQQRALEIHIATDKINRQFTIQDTGIGMTKEEMIDHLGTIARSGSKAFLEQLKAKSGGVPPNDASAIIGQFGVGFYSSFMVAEKVEVFSRKGDDPGYRWATDGSGTYEIQEAEGVQPGTKIVVHLKADCREFSDDDTIKGVIKKYSNFVGSPIFVNGKQVNVIQPLWLMDPKDVKQEMHDEFYRFVSNAYDRPRFSLHYTTDAPLSIRALLYFPEGKPGLFEMSRDTDVGVALYSRKVLIKSRAENILPKWLRFVKGVVDSEDIPLNLSRELLQNSALIRKLKTVLTNRILRFLHDKSQKEVDSYEKFLKDYGLFLKEGIVTSQEQMEKEEISKLLRFESSLKPVGERVSLPQYCGRLKEGQRDIFYLAAPSRALAEASPYYEALRQKDVEVLFCYEPYDELVLMQLREFDRHPLTSIEKEMRQDKEKEDLTDLGPDSLPRSEIESLTSWLKKSLTGKVQSVTVTRRLDSHPCVITVEEMAAARHFIRTQSAQLTEESRFALLQPRLEINTRHPIIKKLSKLSTSNPKLADLVAHQLFSNAMVMAGLVEDPRPLLTGMNELLQLALEKH